MIEIFVVSDPSLAIEAGLVICVVVDCDVGQACCRLAPQALARFVPDTVLRKAIQKIAKSDTSAQVEKISAQVVGWTAW